MSEQTELETLEAVARAICAADTTAPDPDAPIYSGMKSCKAWEGRTGMAQAAIDAQLKAISETHAVVRREPTKEMVSAARCDWHNNHGPQSQTLYGENIYGIWAAMLKAAENTP